MYEQAAREQRELAERVRAAHGRDTLATMESFFGTLKTELVHHGEYPNHDAAPCDLFAYIEAYYNRQQRHSAIGYIVPEQAEAKSA